MTLRLIIGYTSTSVPTNVLHETSQTFKFHFWPFTFIPESTDKITNTRDRRSAQFPVFNVTLLLRGFSLDSDELHEDTTDKRPGKAPPAWADLHFTHFTCFFFVNDRHLTCLWLHSGQLSGIVELLFWDAKSLSFSICVYNVSTSNARNLFMVSFTSHSRSVRG